MRDGGDVGVVSTGQGIFGGRLQPGLAVATDADVADVRRLAVSAARELAFGPGEERVAIVATEMATNLVKYAEDGRVMVRVVEWAERRGVELVAMDRGPGMDDARVRMADGYSSGGTLGGGLGAMARLSNLFDLYSRAGGGTVVMSRLWPDGAPPSNDRQFLAGGVAEAIPGETVSGDAWAVEQRGPRLVALVADGLGHGPDAAAAAEAAVDALRRHHRAPAEEVVAAIHAGLRGTRGAAVAIAEIDRDLGRLRYCGVGNITARLLRGSRYVPLMSHFGIAGYEARRIQVFEYEWTDRAMLLMHSDGLSATWSFDSYPGIDGHHPLLAAATVLRDAARRRDDATVLGIRGA